MDTRWISWILNVLFYIFVSPLLAFLFWLFLIVSWIAAPLIYVGRFFIQAGAFVIRFIANLETLYIFFGVAVLVGIASGFILHYFSKFWIQVFDLDRPAPKKTKPSKGHTPASYRAARERKKNKLDKELRNAAYSRMLTAKPLLAARPLSPDQRQSAADRWLASPQSPTSPKHRDGLLATTILEEVESSGDEYRF